MILCKNEEDVLKRFPTMKIKDEKVVFKVYDSSEFKQSVIFPTDKYPVVGDIEIFSVDNTEQLKDIGILKIIDTVKYEIGHCYGNVERMIEAFKGNEKIKVESYVGWLFIESGDTPIHHCWVVLNDRFLIDLSDDFYSRAINYGNFEKYENKREAFVDFMRESLKHKHSERCYPVGKVFDTCLYIGSKCKPDIGREIYNNLMKKYPNHECTSGSSYGWRISETQKMFIQNGLMKP